MGKWLIEKKKAHYFPLPSLITTVFFSILCTILLYSFRPFLFCRARVIHAVLYTSAVSGSLLVG